MVTKKRTTKKKAARRVIKKDQMSDYQHADEYDPIRSVYYAPYHCQKFIDNCYNGEFPEFFCMLCVIDMDTFNMWRKDYPEFKKAVSIGMTALKAHLLQGAKKGVSRQSFQTHHFNTLMGQYFDDWKSVDKGHGGSEDINPDGTIRAKGLMIIPYNPEVPHPLPDDQNPENQE